MLLEVVQLRAHSATLQLEGFSEKTNTPGIDLIITGGMSNSGFDGKGPNDRE